MSKKTTDLYIYIYEKNSTALLEASRGHRKGDGHAAQQLGDRVDEFFLLDFHEESVF